jgi:chorismate mutase
MSNEAIKKEFDKVNASKREAQILERVKYLTEQLKSEIEYVKRKYETLMNFSDEESYREITINFFIQNKMFNNGLFNTINLQKK